MNAFNVTRIAAYILVGVVIWVAVHKSGIHATLAGVVVAFSIPITASPKQLEPIEFGESNRSQSPLRSLVHSLHTWVAYAILPLFAFANAGVLLKGLDPL